MTCKSFNFQLKQSMNCIHFTVIASYSPCFRLNPHKSRPFSPNHYTRKTPVKTGGCFSNVIARGLGAGFRDFRRCSRSPLAGDEVDQFGEAVINVPEGAVFVGEGFHLSSQGAGVAVFTGLGDE